MARREQSMTPADTEALGAELARDAAPGRRRARRRGARGRQDDVRARRLPRARRHGRRHAAPRSRSASATRRPVPVAHLDLYRVADLRDEDPDLLDDYLRPDTIAFVEWPQGAEAELAGLGRIAVRVRLEHAGGDRRAVEIA